MHRSRHPKDRTPVAMVTGASSGIGLAIARKLLATGWLVLAVSRTVGPAMPVDHGRLVPVPADLRISREVRRVAEEVDKAAESAPAKLDLLVHSAATYADGTWEEAGESLTGVMAVNVGAPAELTALLLPALRTAQGQVVFINSVQGLNAMANVGAYAASKHALKAVADSLRHEVNRHGVRVLSIFPGSTDTPMQQRIQESRGNDYAPERLMQPDDVAEMVLAAVSLPRTAEVTDIVMRPMARSDV